MLSILFFHVVQNARSLKALYRRGTAVSDCYRCCIAMTTAVIALHHNLDGNFYIAPGGKQLIFTWDNIYHARFSLSPLHCHGSLCSARTKLTSLWKKPHGEISTRWTSMPREAGHGPTCTKNGCHDAAARATIDAERGRDSPWLHRIFSYFLSRGRLKPPAFGFAVSWTVYPNNGNEVLA